MTRADAVAAWFRQLSRMAPRLGGEPLRSIAEALADGEPGELLSLAGELEAVAEMVAEEARAEVSAE